jgi:hypothetical protein
MSKKETGCHSSLGIDLALGFGHWTLSCDFVDILPSTNMTPLTGFFKSCPNSWNFEFGSWDFLL